MRFYVTLCLSTLSLASFCFGNMPPPAKGQQAKMVVRYSVEARTQPVLRIPAKFASASVTPAAFPFTPDVRNILSGLLLSLSMLTAGVWFVRRRQKTPSLAALALLMLAGIAAVADIRLPNRPPVAPDTLSPALQSALAQSGGQLSSGILVQIVPTGDEIELLLPRPMRTK